MKAGLWQRFLREEKGFSLAELMTTLLIMLLVLFALYSLFDMSLRVFGFGNDKVEAVENARIGLEKIERELRAAYPYDKGNTTTPDAHLFDSGTWTATQIKFGNDLDGNRRIQCPTSETPPRCEVISYQVYQPAGSSTYTLGRVNSTAGTVQPVIEYVDYVSTSDTGLAFTYLKADGTTAATNESEIAIVRIALRIRVENAQQDGTQTLTTDVALKNRGDG